MKPARTFGGGQRLPVVGMASGLILSSLGRARPFVYVQSDASGRWGCGAVWQYQWIQLPWSDGSVELGIAAKEAIPVVLTAFCWVMTGEGNTYSLRWITAQSRWLCSLVHVVILR